MAIPGAGLHELLCVIVIRTVVGNFLAIVPSPFATC